MKNLMFIALLAFTCMSFTGPTKVETNLAISSSVQVENVADEDYPCRWRTCTYRNGVLISCTPWEYGICVDLDEIVITP